MWKVDEDVPEANDRLGLWTRDELELEGARRMLRSFSSATKGSGMPRAGASGDAHRQDAPCAENNRWSGDDDGETPTGS